MIIYTPNTTASEATGEWDEPVQFTEGLRIESFHDAFIAKCHSLWAELHGRENPTREWFDDWIARVPSFGCSCRSWTNEYIRLNPVDYDNFPAWACLFHDAVNAKLGKPKWKGGS